MKLQAHYINDTNKAFLDLGHGESITKFITKDAGGPDNDLTVEIHGFVTSCGRLIITNERVDRKRADDAN